MVNVTNKIDVQEDELGMPYKEYLEHEYDEYCREQGDGTVWHLRNGFVHFYNGDGVPIPSKHYKPADLTIYK